MRRIHLTHQASPPRLAYFKCLRSQHDIQKILAIRSFGHFPLWPCVRLGAEAHSAAQRHEGGGHHTLRAQKRANSKFTVWFLLNALSLLHHHKVKRLSSSHWNTGTICTVWCRTEANLPQRAGTLMAFKVPLRVPCLRC